ncbi:cullin-like protein, partial [Trifolium medium]|nr:cullin-like protein [Trifolium medium]
MVDFESLKGNDFDVEGLFIRQGCKRYFDMLNGPIYGTLVKEFWMKAQ